MKNLVVTIFILLYFFITGSLTAQTPQAVSYQAVARNNAGTPIANRNISIRVSILSNSPEGNIVYAETHNPQTNQFGLFGLSLGGGNALAGSFSDINWGAGTHFVRVEMDPNGGSNYQLLGTSQLLSVPYALYAKQVENVNDADADPSNEIQQLSLQDNSISISRGNTISLPENLDNDPTNELQTLTLNNNTLSISSGNSIALPTGGESVWSKSGNNIFYNTGKVNVGTNFAFADFNVKGIMAQMDANDRVKLFQGASISTGNGFYSILSNGATPLAFLGTDHAGNSGFLGLYAQNGKSLFLLASSSTNKHGVMELRDTTDKRLVGISAGSGSGSGDIRTYHPNGTQYTTISSVAGENNGGFIGTWGPNGKQNCRLSNLSGNVNHGYISVFNSSADSGSDAKAGIYVNSSGEGIVFGDTKNFRMKHPTQEGKEIWYASLEGPEAAAYVRGTTKLVNGEAQITFPEHFDLVANKETMTVILTPLSADSKGLAVIQKGKGGVKIKELNNGSGNYEFDWEVKAVRKGYENYRVIRDASEAAQGEAAQPVNDINYK